MTLFNHRGVVSPNCGNIVFVMDYFANFIIIFYIYIYIFSAPHFVRVRNDFSGDFAKFKPVQNL